MVLFGGVVVERQSAKKVVVSKAAVKKAGVRARFGQPPLRPTLQSSSRPGIDVADTRLRSDSTSA